jgi:hypothetical protein
LRVVLTGVVVTSGPLVGVVGVVREGVVDDCVMRVASTVVRVTAEVVRDVRTGNFDVPVVVVVVVVLVVRVGAVTRVGR